VQAVLLSPEFAVLGRYPFPLCAPYYPLVGSTSVYMELQRLWTTMKCKKMNLMMMMSMMGL
jgi:hypothetical protein